MLPFVISLNGVAISLRPKCCIDNYSYFASRCYTIVVSRKNRQKNRQGVFIFSVSRPNYKGNQYVCKASIRFVIIVRVKNDNTSLNAWSLANHGGARVVVASGPILIVVIGKMAVDHERNSYTVILWYLIRNPILINAYHWHVSNRGIFMGFSLLLGNQIEGDGGDSHAQD